jgi:hypothetical protein
MDTKSETGQEKDMWKFRGMNRWDLWRKERNMSRRDLAVVHGKRRTKSKEEGDAREGVGTRLRIESACHHVLCAVPTSSAISHPPLLSSAWTMSIKPVAVIDNGTGYTKMGFSGNCEPNYIIPTAISVKQDVGAVGKSNGGIEDLDYFIGNEVQKNKWAAQTDRSHDSSLV